jgi:hypothetical protein
MVAVTLESVLEQARQLQPDEQEQLLTTLERERRIAHLNKKLDEWLNDESGYDEEVWPQVQAALDQTREDLGMRKLFDE